jgi:hypothetical protein
MGDDPALKSCLQKSFATTFKEFIVTQLEKMF